MVGGRGDVRRGCLGRADAIRAATGVAGVKPEPPEHAEGLHRNPAPASHQTVELLLPDGRYMLQRLVRERMPTRDDTRMVLGPESLVEPGTDTHLSGLNDDEPPEKIIASSFDQLGHDFTDV